MSEETHDPSRVPRRPRSVSVIGVAFVLFGLIALPVSLLGLLTAPGQDMGAVDGQPVLTVALAALARVLALVGGIFLLRGSNRARWLLVGWLVYHVLLSMFHDPFEIVMHALLLAAIVFFLFRPAANVYFDPRTPGVLT